MKTSSFSLCMLLFTKINTEVMIKDNSDDDEDLTQYKKTAQCDFLSIVDQTDLAGKGLHEELRKNSRAQLACAENLQRIKTDCQTEQKKQQEVLLTML